MLINVGHYNCVKYINKMKIFTYFLTLFLFFSPISAKEFRIDFTDEGMKALKKKKALVKKLSTPMVMMIRDII